MAHRNIAIVLTLLSSIVTKADGPWKLGLYSTEEKVNLHINLYEESIEVPGMEMFGPMNGYLNGDVYGVWSITSFDIVDDKTAVINLSNDLGSETQKTRLIQTSDSTWTAKFEGGTVIKRVVNKKLVKLPGEITFKRK